MSLPKTIYFMTVGGAIGLLMMAMFIYAAMKSWEIIFNDDIVLVENSKH